MKGSDIVKMVDDFNSGKTVKVSPLNCFRKGVNDHGFNESLIQIPSKYGIESITVPVSNYLDYIGGKDLDPKFHKGFTIGKGKVIYWYFIWHGFSCTVYSSDTSRSARYLKGTELITIHFKLTTP